LGDASLADNHWSLPQVAAGALQVSAQLPGNETAAVLASQCQAHWLMGGIHAEPGQVFLEGQRDAIIPVRGKDKARLV